MDVKYLDSCLRAIDVELQSGNTSAAMSLIDSSLSNFPPDDHQILLRLALCRYHLGDKKVALELQQELVSRFPDNPDIAHRWISWSVESGDIVAVRPVLDVWRRQLPDHPWFWLNEIRVLRLTGKHVESLLELRRFVLSNPEMAVGWRELFVAEVLSGSASSLNDAVKNALVALPDSLVVARAALSSSLDSKNLELASLAYENLLSIDPELDKNSPHLACRFKLLSIFSCYANGQQDVALVEIVELMKRFPDIPAPARHYVEWIIGRSLFSEAVPVIDSWRARLPDDLNFAVLEIKLLRKMGGRNRASALCDDLIKRQPKLELAWVERILLSEFDQSGDYFNENAVHALALFPQSFCIIQALYFGAIERGMFDFISVMLKDFLKTCQESLDAYRLAALFYFQQTEYPTALDIVNDGLSKFPEDYQLRLLCLQVNRALEIDKSSWVGRAQALFLDAKLDANGLYVAMSIMSNAGQNAQLLKLLRDVAKNDSLDLVVRDAAGKMLNSLSLDMEQHETKRSDVRLGGAVVQRLFPGVRHVVLGFGGLAGALLLDLVQPSMEKLGLGWIFLGDRQKVLFLNGVAELGEDYDQTLNAINMLIPDSVTSITCLGNSAGGYAALRYAIDLKASSALLFAPPTNLDAEACSRDGRAKVVAHRIHKLVPHQALNLAQVLTDATHKPDVHLWYGGAMPQDREHALNMAGVPGVTLHEEPNYQDHDVLLHLASTGRLELALRQAILGNEA